MSIWPSWPPEFRLCDIVVKMPRNHRFRGIFDCYRLQSASGNGVETLGAQLFQQCHFIGIE